MFSRRGENLYSNPKCPPGGREKSTLSSGEVRMGSSRRGIIPALARLGHRRVRLGLRVRSGGSAGGDPSPTRAGRVRGHSRAPARAARGHPRRSRVQSPVRRHATRGAAAGTRDLAAAQGSATARQGDRGRTATSAGRPRCAGAAGPAGPAGPDAAAPAAW